MQPASSFVRNLIRANLHVHLQVDTLLRELCRLHKIEIPYEAMTLMPGESSSAKCDEGFSAQQTVEQKINHDDTIEEVEVDLDSLDSIESDDDLFEV